MRVHITAYVVLPGPAAAFELPGPAAAFEVCEGVWGAYGGLATACTIAATSNSFHDTHATPDCNWRPGCFALRFFLPF